MGWSATQTDNTSLKVYLFTLCFIDFLLLLWGILLAYLKFTHSVRMFGVTIIGDVPSTLKVILLLKAFRLRRTFRAMTPEQQQEFLDTVQTLPGMTVQDNTVSIDDIRKLKTSLKL